jgi:hypothetical protein
MIKNIRGMLISLHVIKHADQRFAYKLVWANPLSWVFLIVCLIVYLIKGTLLGIFEFIMDVEKLT